MRLVLRLLPLALMLLTCTRDKLIAASCRTDDDCGPGYLCEGFECAPSQTKSCDTVLDGNPILQPTPHVVDFGTLTTQAAVVDTVGLHNIGNCTLTIFEASLKDSAAGFSCDLCGTKFPKEIFPGRSIDLNVGYAASTVGATTTELVLLSDDKEYPTLRVPIRAAYQGTPALAATPANIDFGYLAQGQLLKRNVQLTNVGSGTAPVTIKSVTLTPAGTQNFAVVAPADLPRVMSPITLDRKAVETVEVRYTPRTTDDHTAILAITTDLGVVSVPLTGTAKTPPAAAVSPTHVDIGDVTLGTSNFQTLTVTNNGGAPLTITPHFALGTSSDFYITPNKPPAIEPGKYLELQVGFTATVAGKLGPVILTLDTNDPQNPSISVPVTANGVAAAGASVVKVDVTYDTANDGTFTQDIRQMELTLEHPFGFVCNKTNPNPTNWGNFGTCGWLSLGDKDNPARVVLANPTQDGTWRVQLSYTQDCSALPTALLASVLGIALNALQDWLAGTVIIPGQDVGQIIQKYCFSHDSSSADVKVYVNGVQVAEKNATLGATGNTTYVLNLVRTNGTFTVK